MIDRGGTLLCPSMHKAVKKYIITVFTICRLSSSAAALASLLERSCTEQIIGIKNTPYSTTGPASWCTVPGGSSAGFFTTKIPGSDPNRIVIMQIEVAALSCFFSAVDPYGIRLNPHLCKLGESKFWKKKIHNNKTREKDLFLPRSELIFIIIL
jgi:hypothetical protein